MRKRLQELPESVQAAHVGARGQVRAARIAAAATVLGAVIGPVAGVFLGVLQYTGPGGSEPRTIALPPETRPVTADPPGGPATSLPPVGATYLIDLQAVAGSSDYETGVGRIDTESFGRSISAIASCRRERQIEFPLNRSFTEFTSVIGPSDDSESGTTIAFSVSVDDRRVDPIFIDVGSSQEFVVDVTDGFRLVLTYVSTEFSDGSCPDPAVAVWGDARLT